MQLQGLQFRQRLNRWSDYFAFKKFRGDLQTFEAKLENRQDLYSEERKRDSKNAEIFAQQSIRNDVNEILLWISCQPSKSTQRVWKSRFFFTNWPQRHQPNWADWSRHLQRTTAWMSSIRPLIPWLLVEICQFIGMCTSWTRGSWRFKNSSVDIPAARKPSQSCILLSETNQNLYLWSISRSLTM